jgi:hypothetical protein
MMMTAAERSSSYCAQAGIVMTSRAREAWMVAPLAATAAFWALAYIAGAVQAKSLPFGGDPNAVFGMLFLYLLFGLPIAYFVTFAVVYPLFLCLRWRGGFVFVRLFPFEIELRAVAIPGRAA